MKYRIKPSRQVIQFTNRLHPDTRRKCKRALVDLENWKGNIIPLARVMAGFYRVRVGNYRFIFAVRTDLMIDVVFAQERDVVYQLFEAMILAGELEPLT